MIFAVAAATISEFRIQRSSFNLMARHLVWISSSTANNQSLQTIRTGGNERCFFRDCERELPDPHSEVTGSIIGLAVVEAAGTVPCGDLLTHLDGRRAQAQCVTPNDD